MGTFVAFTLLVVLITMTWTLTCTSLIQKICSSFTVRAELPEPRRHQGGRNKIGDVAQRGSKGGEGDLPAVPALLHDGQDQGEEGERKSRVSLDDRNSQTSPQNQGARGSNQVGGKDSPDLPSSFHNPNVLPSWEEIDEQVS